MSEIGGYSGDEAMKKMNLRFIVLILFLFTSFGTIFYNFGDHEDIAELVPKDRCVKSAYNDDSKNHKISINCRGYSGEVYTINARRWNDQSKIENIASNLKEGEVVKSFICSEFKPSGEERFSEEIRHLHTCLSKENGITITSNSRAAVVFYIELFEK
ncbi:hypothetical protein [Paracidovorax oryzae]|uniref:hypothetical protein n=1 Tax=Paracidovorax oryzae TaxID=862720 RepID=UPI0012EC365E|nr:hypothetical protein [Paracidovorax oryzae]